MHDHDKNNNQAAPQNVYPKNNDYQQMLIAAFLIGEMFAIKKKIGIIGSIPFLNTYHERFKTRFLIRI